MSPNNILDQIWETYQITIDCLKIASRCVDSGEYTLLKRTNFIGISPTEAGKGISTSRSEGDDYIILSLWAAFERQVYSCLQKECEKILDGNGSNFNKSVRRKIDEEIEYWRIDDILDLFKFIVSSDLIGNAKQIKRYRDWIAHKNPRKGPPSNVLPVNAYRVFSTILSCLGQVRT